jgi:hypothetical protein
MAYQYANIENYLHGIAFKGRLAYAMWAWSVGTLQGTGEFTEAVKIPSLPASAAPMINFAGHLGLAHLKSVSADLPMGSRAWAISGVRKLPLPAVSAMRLPSLGAYRPHRHSCRAAGPVLAPERLEQTRGGPEPRIERLMEAMFFENGCRNQR